MKILVIGFGLLGKQVCEEMVKQGFDVISLDYPEIDITKYDLVLQKIQQIQPDILINCAAYTNVDLAEKEAGKCWDINYNGVVNLTSVCASLNILLIHISTDYVFDGAERKEYPETAKTNPLNSYGLSKAEADSFILNKNHGLKFYIFRITWLFGRHGGNFVDTVIKIALNKNQASFVADQVASPISTESLAKIIAVFCQRYQTSEQIPFGLYNATSLGKCSCYELADKTIELYSSLINSNLAIQKITPITSEDWKWLNPGKQIAKRPAFSVLDKTKLLAALGKEKDLLKHWTEDLKDYIMSKKSV